jgi:hypothetical protein
MKYTGQDFSTTEEPQEELNIETEVGFYIQKPV